MTERHHFYSKRFRHKHDKVRAHISQNYSYGRYSECKREYLSKYQNELKIIHIYEKNEQKSKKKTNTVVSKNYLIINWLMFKWKKFWQFCYLCSSQSELVIHIDTSFFSFGKVFTIFRHLRSACILCSFRQI